MPGTPKTPNDVLDLANSFFAARALLAAARANIFGAIAERPRTAAEVAKATGNDPRAVDLLLHALVALGLVEKAGDRFAPGALARECLVPGSPRDVTDYLKLNADTFESWSRFEEALRTGAPVEVSSRAAREGSPERHRDFILAMRGTARGTAPLVAERLDLAALLGRAPASLVDVGGGPGTFAIELARRWPGLRATVLDLPETVAIARELAAGEADRGVAARIEFRDADFHRDPLGGPYDVAWVSHVIHGHPEATLLPLLKRVREAVVPGGLIAVHDFILDDGRTTPAYGAVFALNMLVMSDHGRCYAEGEVRGLLEAAGFTGVARREMGLPRGLSVMTGRR